MKTKLQALLFVIFSLLNFTTNAQDTELWGMTSQGGDYAAGTIFKTDNDGNNQVLEASFEYNQGRYPQYSKLCKASNGKLYGLTYQGGNSGSGVIYSYDPISEQYIKEFDFNNSTTYGRNPYGSLIEATDGKLYGMTNMGGINNNGVIFSFDPTTATYVKHYDFDSITSGRSPYGSLMEATDGRLYGMTLAGGINNIGVLFSYDPATSIYIKHFDFDGTNNGANPYGSLIEAIDGKLYGMTRQGGINNLGVLFSFNPVLSVYTKHSDFDATVGYFPYGSLTEAGDGKLYGMTSSGGTNNNGVLFSYNPATITYTKHLDFDGTTNGRDPRGSLVEASDGKLYGLTANGGTNNGGTLFSFDINTTTTDKLFDFVTINGSVPVGSVMESTSGKFYGVTSSGGTKNFGVIFQFDLNTNSYSKKVNFEESKNGRNPYGSLVEAENGNLYGTTYTGGSDYSVLFEYNPITQTTSKKAEFGQFTHRGNLIKNSQGEIFGIIRNTATSSGTSNISGWIFSYNCVSNVKTNVRGISKPYYNMAFNESTDIAYVSSERYWSSGSWSTNYYGSRLQSYNTLTNTLSTLYTFPYNDGDIKSLVFHSSNKLYGIVSAGGSGAYGRLFEFDLNTNTLSILLEFDNINGNGTGISSLVISLEGKLYGTTQLGGTNNFGILFSYDPLTSTYTKELDFDNSSQGVYPVGNLLAASNGKLYGMITQGGINSLGVLFEFDPTTNTYTKKLDFNGTNGSRPQYGALIEVKKAVIWTTANEWSNVVGPTIDDVTIIEGDLAVGTDFGDFSAKSLTIRAGGSLVIESGHVVTVNAHITNLATEADFVVESGANLVQLKDFQNEGSATVKRESAPIVRLDYTAWGAPVEGQNLLDFSPQTLPNRFYTYDYTGTTTATAWIPVADPSTINFEPSHGYLLRAPNTWSASVYTPYQGEFIGKPNNGSFQNTVGVGYNLLGNPYPSPLSADAFLNANAALGVSSLYYWTHAVPQNGAYVPQTNYASYNLSGGTAAVAGGAQPDEFIQVGQGFLVNIATAGQAQFTNAQRSDSSNNQFFKTTTTDVDRFWLGLRNDNASYNQILVAYVNGTTNGIDLGYDAKLLTNGNSHLSSLINNENYVIQGRNSVFEINDEVPLSFTAEQSGMFTISLDAVEGIFDLQDILLWDKQLNIYHNLQTNDYSFTTNAGTFNNRFSVVYDSALNNQTFDSENNILIYKSNESLVISSNNIIIENVKVYDIQGRLLVEKNGVNASSIIISEIKAKNQVLLVAIQTDNGSVTKKIGF